MNDICKQRLNECLHGSMILDKDPESGYFDAPKGSPKFPTLSSTQVKRHTPQARKPRECLNESLNSSGWEDSTAFTYVNSSE